MSSGGGSDGGPVQAWVVDIVIRGVAGTVGGFYAPLPTFDNREQALEHYRATLIRYVEENLFHDAHYRLVLQPAADPPGVDVEFRRSAPLPPRRTYRWGHL